MKSTILPTVSLNFKQCSYCSVIQFLIEIKKNQCSYVNEPSKKFSAKTSCNSEPRHCPYTHNSLKNLRDSGQYSWGNRIFIAHSCQSLIYVPLFILFWIPVTKQSQVKRKKKNTSKINSNHTTYVQNRFNFFKMDLYFAQNKLPE